MPSRRYRARLLDLGSLEAMRREMTRIDVDRGGIPIMSSKGIQRNILLEQIPTAAANCIKQEVLARGGDLAVPASAAGFEEPYVDAILIGNLTTLRSLISKLYRQAVFDMPQIADAIQNLLVRTTPGYLPVSPRPNRQGVVVEETLEDLMGGRIPLMPGTYRATGRPTLADLPERPPWRFGDMTYVMGVVEVPPGFGPDDGAAWRRVEQLAADGAHLIEIGSESGGDREHHASGVQDEIGRVIALIRRVRRELPAQIIAVAARQAQAAEAAVEAGAHIISPGWDCHDPGISRVAAATGVPIVITHDQAQGTRYQDLLTDVARFFDEAIEAAVAAGVKPEQVILDPGFGLGKTSGQDLELTRRLRELTGFGRPILHAPSRRRTTGRVLGYPETAPERLAGTAALVSLGIAAGADIVRVDDVAHMVRCARVTDALVRGSALPDE